MINRQLKRRNPIVFFDFDHTITTCDVFDNLLLHFAKDDRWKELEESWKAGKIGSQECLQGQLKSINITRNKLDEYLAEIKIDPYFKRIIKLLVAKKITTIILSDNFDYILKRILKNNAIKQLRVFSNRLKFAKGRLLPYFPFRSKDCKLCGHCKKKNLLANAKQNSLIFFIGDGRSDICPAQAADVVFAKKDLLEFYKGKNLTCLPYRDLKDVYNYFKRSLK